MEIPHIDMDAVRAAKEANSSGDSVFIAQKQIPKKQNDDDLGMLVHLLPGYHTPDNLPIYTEEGYWVNNNRLVSGATFGRPSPDEAYMKEIYSRAKTDAKLKALLDAESFSRKRINYVPVVVCEIDFENDVIVSTGEPGQVIQVGPQIANQLFDHIANKAYRKTSDKLGLISPTEGRLISLYKVVTDNTKYHAVVYPEKMELPNYEELYKKDNVFDAPAHVRSKYYGDDYVLAVLKNYFEGTPLPDKPEANGDPETGELLAVINTKDKKKLKDSANVVKKDKKKKKKKKS